MSKELSVILRETRLRTGCDQKSFAKQFNLTQSAYSRYEKGKSLPPVERIKEMVDEYNMPIYDYFYESIIRMITSLPRNEFELSLLNNEYTDKPLRKKGSTKKNKDVIHCVLDLVNMIESIREFYNNEDFEKLIRTILVQYNYDDKKVFDEIGEYIKLKLK